MKHKVTLHEWQAFDRTTIIEVEHGEHDNPGDIASGSISAAKNPDEAFNWDYGQQGMYELEVEHVECVDHPRCHLAEGDEDAG